MSGIDFTPILNVPELRKVIADIEDWQIEQFVRHMAQKTGDVPDCECGAGRHYRDADIEVTPEGRIEVTSQWACDREGDCPAAESEFRYRCLETTTDYSPNRFAEEYRSMMAYEKHKAETLAQAIEQIDAMEIDTDKIDQLLDD